MTVQTIFPFTTPANYVIGAGAEVAGGNAQLVQTPSAKTDDEDYNTPANYSIPEPAKLQVTGGNAELVAPSGPKSHTEDFADDTGFTYDNTKVEFVAGQVQHKLRALTTDELLVASYNTDEDAEISAGSGVGTLVNGATVSGGFLDLTGAATAKYCSYPSASNFPTGRTGCIRALIKPAYSGNPSGNQNIFTANVIGNNNNLTAVQHASDGNLKIIVYNSSGSVIFSPSLGVWNPTSGVIYEFEFNYDTLTGASRLFIDGVQFGSTETATGARTSVGEVKIGTSRTASLLPNFSIGSIQFFEEPQHTANYTPAAIILFDLNNVDLPQIVHVGPGAFINGDTFVTVETGAPRWTIKIDANNYKYWDGGAWSDSNGTYAQASSTADINTNLATHPDVPGGLTGDIRLHFTSSVTPHAVDNLVITHNETLLYDTGNPIVTPTASLDESAIEDGVGSWDSYTESSTKPANTELQYILSFDDGTTFYYWSGAAWVIADETFAQSNTAAIINTNMGTFPITNSKLMIRAFLNTTDGLETPLLNNIQIGWTTIGALPKTNPTVVPNTTFRTDLLLSITETSVKPGTAEVKYTLGKDGVHYYWTGAVWAVADGTYAQSNTAAEVNANASTFTTQTVAGIEVEVKIFLHTDSDTDNPQLDQLVVSYDFTGAVAAILEFSSIWGYHKDRSGNPSTDPVYVELENQAVEYKDQTTIFKETREKIIPNTDGYWEVNLLETDNMDSGEEHYIFYFGERRLRRKVPNIASNNFWNLVE